MDQTLIENTVIRCFCPSKICLAASCSLCPTLWYAWWATCWSWWPRYRKLWREFICNNDLSVYCLCPCRHVCCWRRAMTRQRAVRTMVWCGRGWRAENPGVRRVGEVNVVIRCGLRQNVVSIITFSLSRLSLIYLTFIGHTCLWTRGLWALFSSLFTLVMVYKLALLQCERQITHLFRVFFHSVTHISLFLACLTLYGSCFDYWYGNGRHVW